MKERMIGAIGVLLLGSLPVAADSPVDPYERTACTAIVTQLEPPEQAFVVTKIVRAAYGMELPFVLIPDKTAGGDEQTREPPTSFELVFTGHSGYVFRRPNTAEFQWSHADLSPLYRREYDGDEIDCYVMELSRLEGLSTVAIDRYTGNLFSGRYHDGFLTLRVLDPENSLLAQVGIDLLGRGALVDVTGSPASELAGPKTRREGHFWLDGGRLASFVNTYYRVGGESYARYLADAFFLVWLYSDLSSAPERPGLRLPYLPLADKEPLPEKQRPVDNLGGLGGNYVSEGEVERKRTAWTGGGAVSLLHLLEHRDCEEQTCPSYSTMALHTEMLRRHPERMRAGESFNFGTTFNVLADRGFCESRFYPVIGNADLSKIGKLQAFSRRAEKALSKSMKQRGATSDPGLVEFLRVTEGSSIKFDEDLPPLCKQEMERSRQGLERHALVELMRPDASPENAAVSEEQRNELYDAQGQELMSMIFRLLRAGRVVALIGDSDSLPSDSALAYGWNTDGLLVLVSDAAPERRWQVLPFDEVRRSVRTVAFLRADIGSTDWETELLRALEFSPDVAWVRHELGQIYKGRGWHERAVGHLRRAVELDLTRGRAWQNLAYSLNQIGAYERAVEALNIAMRQGWDTAWTHRELGLALRRLGRLEDAEKAFRTALEKDDTNTWAWRQLGWSLYEQGRPAEAEQCFKEAIARSPDSAWVNLELADFYVYSGRREDGLRELQRFAAEDFGPDERAAIGDHLAMYGFAEEAHPVLEGVLEQHPDNRRARIALARLYRLDGNLQDVNRVLAPLENELLSRIEELSADDLLDLAFAQALGGKNEAAEASLRLSGERAVELAAGQLYDMACVHALNESKEPALDFLRRALDKGYREFEWFQRDSDLAGIAETAAFKALLESYRD